MPHNTELNRLATEVARVGGWQWDLASSELRWSDQVYAIHAIPPGTRVSVEQGIAGYAPEYQAHLRQLVEACRTRGEAFDEELEILTATGQRTWVRVIGRAVRDKSGAIVRLEGALQDITREHEFRHEMRAASRQHFRQFAESMPHIIWTATADGRIDYSSRENAHPTGPARAPMAEKWIDHVHRDDVDQVVGKWISAIRAGQSFSIELRIWTEEHKDYRWHLVSATPIRDDAGCIIKWYGSSIDIHDRKQAEEQAARLGKRLSNTLESMTDAFLLLDHAWRFIYVNSEAERMLQHSREQLLGQVVWEVFRDAVGGEFDLQYRRAVREGVSVHFESYYPALDKWFEVRAFPSEEGLAVYFHDLTLSKRAEAAARESHERFHIVCKATSDVIWDWDLKSDQLWWNENIELQYGTPRESLEHDSKSWTSRIHPDDAQRILDSVGAAIAGDAEHWVDEYRFRRGNGSYAAVLDRGFIIREAGGAAVRMVGSMTDITERAAAQGKIHRLAFYDPLTRLPNRSLLQDRLQQAFEHSKRDGRPGALLFIDLDNFKTLNDTFGHDTGDLLLQQVSDRLLECVRKTDTVARLGGDEFVIMLEGLSPDDEEARQQAATLAQKVVDSFARPCKLNGHLHYSTASIGVAMFRASCAHVADILKRADLAMYQAKSDGRNTIRFFDPQMQDRLLARTRLETDLREALRRQDFILHYQPQFDAAGHMTGAEALVRWRHPQRGLIYPRDFIAIAEETGQIVALGEWILRSTCGQLAAWRDNPRTAHWTIAVNVSAGQFLQPDFVEQILACVQKSGADPQKLTLELTETVFVHDIENVIGKMVRLKQAGIRFSLDDFGTGYSSLSYLRRLPLDQLKIDRSFVMDLPGNANAEAIARTVINMGAALGLTVIAEGVERAEQAAFLRQQGCGAFQGYYFAPPMPLESLLEQCLPGTGLARPKRF